MGANDGVGRVLRAMSLAVLAWAGCHGGTPIVETRYVVSVGTIDMQTNVATDPASEFYPFFFSNVDFPPWVDWAQTVRIVRWPSTDLVPGTWREEQATWGESFLRF